MILATAASGELSIYSRSLRRLAYAVMLERYHAFHRRLMMRINNHLAARGNQVEAVFGRDRLHNMAKPKKLKVYRTPIGFHDAYVAASSQKAALEAWGSSHNLFARGVAEIVTDEALTEEPLASPGKVIKRSRGTTAEQIAALPADKKRSAITRDEAPTDDEAPAKKTPRVAKPKPKPSRSALDTAEGKLAELEDRHGDARRALDAERAEIDRRRGELEKCQKAEIAKAQQQVDRAEEKYEAAIRRWRG